jgi:hypothetical protein
VGTGGVVLGKKSDCRQPADGKNASRCFSKAFDGSKHLALSASEEDERVETATQLRRKFAKMREGVF